MLEDLKLHVRTWCASIKRKKKLHILFSLRFHLLCFSRLVSYRFFFLFRTICSRFYFFFFYIGFFFFIHTSKAAVNKPYLNMNNLSLATAFKTHRHSPSLLSLFSPPRLSKLNPLCWSVMQTSRKNASELWAVFMSKSCMHKDGEARTKRDVESREIKGCTKKEEQMKKKLFIYRTAGLGPGLRTVITHDQQRGRAEITGRCCDAHPGVQMKLHKTKQCTSRREEYGELE